MKAVITEKAVMLIESSNVITFEVDRSLTKTALKKEIENIFGVKIESMRTLIKNNKKYVYVKLKKEFPAIDIATKLGII